MISQDLLDQAIETFTNEYEAFVCINSSHLSDPIESISRDPTSESVQKFLREALRVMRAAYYLSGDADRAIFWYRNEQLPSFGYKTAEQLVSEGRTEDVLRYVGSLEAGDAG